MIVGDKLKINEKYELELEPLIEVLRFHKDKISLAYIGAHKSFIRNFDEAKEEFGKLDNDIFNGRLFFSDLIHLKEKFLTNDDFKFIRTVKTTKRK